LHPIGKGCGSKFDDAVHGGRLQSSRHHGRQLAELQNVDMNRGLLFGMLTGLGLVVGCYASAVFRLPAAIVFCILCLPGALLDDLMTQPPMRSHGWHWFIIGNLLFYGLMGLGLNRAFRSRPPYPGHCPYCGYNLRGYTAGIFPECGTKL
jgi:hypothetical protein